MFLPKGWFPFQPDSNSIPAKSPPFLPELWIKHQGLCDGPVCQLVGDE
jgi:hypothetical protein